MEDRKNYENENIEQNREQTSAEKLVRYINNTVDKEVSKRMSKNRKSNFAKFTLGVLLASGLSSGATAMFLNSKSQNVQIGSTQQAVQISTSSEVNVEKAVAKKATNSVVGITTQGVSEDIFNRQTQYSGIGSGVIVSKDGYILTNNHVVDPKSTKEANVILSDGTKLDAKVLWADKTLDLAVIKVEPKGVELQPIEIADSNAVEVGDKAIAIGSPLGINLQSTLTSGYISGKDRTISFENGSTMEGLLQTDASINPGNSGGALLNAKGELIGINTAKSGGSDGIGFAIPINVAKPILNQIIKTGKFEMVVLGIKGIDVDRFNSLSKEQLDAESGVYVHEVLEGYPAFESGIKPKDIIIKIGETDIHTNSNIKSALLNFKDGDSTEIVVLREGKEVKLNVTFAKKS